jgi:hypothetical protein
MTVNNPKYPPRPPVFIIPTGSGGTIGSAGSGGAASMGGSGGSNGSCTPVGSSCSSSSQCCTGSACSNGAEALPGTCENCSAALGTFNATCPASGCLAGLLAFCGTYNWPNDFGNNGGIANGGTFTLPYGYAISYPTGTSLETGIGGTIQICSSYNQPNIYGGATSAPSAIPGCQCEYQCFVIPVAPLGTPNGTDPCIPPSGKYCGCLVNGDCASGVCSSGTCQ